MRGLGGLFVSPMFPYSTWSLVLYSGFRVLLRWATRLNAVFPVRGRRPRIRMSVRIWSRLFSGCSRWTWPVRRISFRSGKGKDRVASNRNRRLNVSIRGQAGGNKLPLANL